MARVAKVLGNLSLWRAIIAEAIGSFFLVLIGTGSGIQNWDQKTDFQPSVVHIALASGLVVASMVQAIYHVSGCHINPAVTCGMMATSKIHPMRGCFYVAAQCCGAICASATLQALTPAVMRGTLGMTQLHGDLAPAQGFCMEFIITFMLILVIFGACDKNRSDVGGSAALAIGFAVTAGHLIAVKYTGSSMNPARTFGPAVITGIWHEHWIYWAGPCLGGIAAAVLYENVFRAPAPGQSNCSYVVTKETNGEKDNADELLVTDRTTSI